MLTILRLLSVLALMAAVAAGVADTVQSFAADMPVMTSTLTLVQFLSPDAYGRAETYVSGLPQGPRIVDAMTWTVTQPAFALLLVVSLILWMLAYRKPRPAGRFAA